MKTSPCLHSLVPARYCSHPHPTAVFLSCSSVRLRLPASACPNALPAATKCTRNNKTLACFGFLPSQVIGGNGRRHLCVLLVLPALSKRWDLLVGHLPWPRRTPRFTATFAHCIVFSLENKIKLHTPGEPQARPLPPINLPAQWYRKRYLEALSPPCCLALAFMLLSAYRRSSPATRVLRLVSISVVASAASAACFTNQDDCGSSNSCW